MRHRSGFERFRPHIKEAAVQDQTMRIVEGLDEFFSNHPAETTVDWEKFAEWFVHTRTGRLPPAEIKGMRLYFDRLKVAPPSTPTQEDILHHYIVADYAERIKDVVDYGALTDMQDVRQLVEDYEVETKRAVTKSDLFTSFDLASIGNTATGPGWHWRLKELDEILGPLRGGDMVIVAARPEIGKTTFVASEVSWMAEQMQNAGEKRPILFIANEEHTDKVKLRLMMASLGQPQSYVLADKAQSLALFEGFVGKDRILIPRSDMGLNHTRQLTQLFKDNPPGLIVFDQLDNVDTKVAKDERDDLRIGKVYTWARRLGHEYNCPVIAVSQLNGTAEGEKYPGMNQLRGSQTDKPGAADAIITIGVDPTSVDDRHFNVPKNKLTGKHAMFVVKIQPDVARYVGKK
jgi:replicative DNA helicase